MMAYVSWSVVFGEQPSAAKWNILGTNDQSFNDGSGIATLEIGSGHTALKNDYKFSAYRNAAFSSATSVALTLDTELYDTSNNFDTTNGRFTAPVAGFYHFSGGLAISSAANNAGAVSLFKNGSLIKAGSISLNGASSFQWNGIVSADLQLSVSDYVQLAVFTNSNSGVTGATNTFLDGHLISNT